MVIEMKLCEYVNNLISLNMLNNQIKAKKIEKINFENLSFQNINIMSVSPFSYENTNISLKVEKEAHEPIYKIIGKHILNEEFIDEYIKKFGVIPLYLQIEIFGIYYIPSRHITLNEYYFGSLPFVVELKFER